MRIYRTLQEALQASDTRWERPFVCPVHDDHNASASVNTQKGLWVCFTCGAKGTTRGLEFEPELDVDYINDLLSEPMALPESIMDLFCPGPVHPYWLSRFSEAACRHFQLGYDPSKERPCYPLRGELGELLGVVTRKIDPDEPGPKYKYPARIKTHNFLFNYQRDLDRVVLVEGAVDAVACWEVDVEAFGIYGSQISNRQVELINATGASEILCAFDNDRAGYKAYLQARELFPAMDVRSLDWGTYGKYNDVAEMPLDVRSIALSPTFREDLALS